MVRHNSQRKDKRLFTAAGDGEKIQAYQASDERDEGRWIASEIDKLHDGGTPYDDIAVFYRTNAQSRILEDMFLRAGVPYKIVGGTRFFDRAEVRDVMAYLKMVVNPADEMSVKRVINTPRRGIGSTSIQKIEMLAVSNRCSFFQACELACAEDRHVLGQGSPTAWPISSTSCAVVAVWMASSKTWSRLLWRARALSRRIAVRARWRPRGAPRTFRNSWV